LCLAHLHELVHRLHDDEEHPHPDQEERDDVVDEDPIEEVALSDSELELAEVRLPWDCYERSEDVRNERSDDAPKRRPDGNSDREVEDVTAQDEKS
jgi:hypothetical protein